MNKSTYTEDEVKKVFHTLFIEKKRVKELEERLNTIESEKKGFEERLEALKASEAHSFSLVGSELNDRLSHFLEKNRGDAQGHDPIDQLDAQYRKLTELNKTQNEKLAALQKELDAKNAEIQKTPTTEDVEKLKQFVIYAKKKHLEASALQKDAQESLKAAHSNWEKKFKEKEELLNTLQKSNIKLKEELAELQKTIQEHAQEGISGGRDSSKVLEELQTTCRQQKQRLNQLEDNYAKQLKEIEHLKETKRTAQEKFEEKNHLLQGALRECETLRKNLNDIQNRQLASLTSEEIQRLQEELGKAKELSDLSHQERLKAEQKLEEAHRQQQQQLEEAQSLKKILEEELLQKQEKHSLIEKLKRDLETSQKELVFVKTALNESIDHQTFIKSEVEGKESAQHRALIDLKEKLFRSDEEKNRLLHKTEELFQTLQKVQEQNLFAKQQIEKLLESLQLKDRQVVALKEFEYSYKKLNQQKLDLEKVIRDERETLLNTDQQVQYLSQEIQKRDHLLNEKDEKLKQLEKDLEEKANLHTLLREEVKKLETQIADINQRNESLSESYLEIQEQSLQESDRFKRHLEEAARIRQGLEGELQQRLGDLDKLKKEIDLIKQTLVKGVRDAHEIEELYSQAITDKHVAIQQLQNVLAESDQIKNDSAAFYEDLKKAEEQSRLQQEKIGQLEQLFELSQREKTELIEENAKQSEILSSLNLQLSELTSSLQISTGLEENRRIEIDQLQEELLKQQTHAEQQAAELQASQDKLHEQEKSLEALAKEKSDLKTQLDEELVKLSAADTAYQELQNSKYEIDDRYSSLLDDYRSLSANMEEALDARYESEKQFTELQAHYEAKQQIILESSRELERAHTLKQTFEQQLQEAQTVIEDREQRLLLAQQQFGKKVKEQALIQKKIEEQNAELVEVQNQLNHQKAKITELQSHLDQQQEQEKRLQDLLNESIKSTKSQVQEWEKKYFHVYEELNKAESRIKELRKWEGEYRKLHSLLSNLGTFLGNPIAMPQLPGNTMNADLSDASDEAESEEVTFSAPSLSVSSFKSKQTNSSKNSKNIVEVQEDLFKADAPASQPTSYQEILF